MPNWRVSPDPCYFLTLVPGRQVPFLVRGVCSHPRPYRVIAYVVNLDRAGTKGPTHQPYGSGSIWEGTTLLVGLEYARIKVASNISKAYKKLLKISELALKKQSSKLIELKLSLWMSIKIFTVSLQQQIKKPTNFSISCLSEQYTMGKLLSCFLLNLFLQLAPKFKP